MKRLFTFGCSFTNYKWASWADILGLEYDHYENWGIGGSSNHFIFYSLAEFLQRNTLTDSDTVVIMWTEINRDSKFVKNKWVQSIDSNIYNKEATVDDVNGHLITNANIIAGVKRMLESTKCNFHFLAMTKPDDTNHQFIDLSNRSTRNIFNAYKSVFDFIHPSMYDIIFNFDWRSRITDDTPLRYPTPEFLNKTYNNLKNEYETVKGKDWPPLLNAMGKEFDGVSDFIQDEILVNFSWAIDILSGDIIPKDLHLLPMDHFEYLAKLGIWDLTQKQLEQTEAWQQDLTTRSHASMQDKVERF